MLRTQLAEWSDKMAVFRYKMQGILNIKEKLETRAKQDFAEANNRLAEEKEKLAELQRRKAAYMEEGVALRLEHIDVRKIRENKMAVMKMDEYIARQIVQINQAVKAVERARIALQELVQERKTHEKLKENAFAEFVREELYQENKEIDQLTTYTHGQKLMGENEHGR
ncbi:MAG: flagellar export protein FliJ [Lachnospiraceae bacterium]|nr:flagellar export protein FliJ [Lachnospiraceae bacterium]